MIIYTGGTIGMINQPGARSLSPFDFDQILRHVPEIEKFGFKFTPVTIRSVVDSSNIKPVALKPREILHRIVAAKQQVLSPDEFAKLHSGDPACELTAGVYRIYQQISNIVKINLYRLITGLEMSVLFHGAFQLFLIDRL